MKGFIKFPRELVEHEVFNNQFDFRLLMLILNGAIFIDEYEFAEFKLKKGEWVRSYRKLQEDLMYIEKNKKITPSVWQIQQAVRRLTEYGFITKSSTGLSTVFKLDKVLVDQLFGHTETSDRVHSRVQQTDKVEYNNNNVLINNNVLKKNVKEQQHKSGCSFYDTYYTCYGRYLNPIQLQQFMSYLEVDGIEEELLCYAFESASKVSSHINYCKAIVNSWIAKGIKTYAGAVEDNARQRGDTNVKPAKRDQYSNIDFGI